MAEEKVVKVVFCPACGSKLRALGQGDGALWCEWCELALPPEVGVGGVKQPPKPGN